MRTNQQLLGGHIVLPGTVTATPVYEKVFEGNLLERGPTYSAHMADKDSQSSLKLTINRVLTQPVNQLQTGMFSQARLTWNAGRGGGNNVAEMDVGAGGTTVVLGAVTYLMVEIAHVAQVPVEATFDVSWVEHYGGLVLPATFTNRVSVLATATSARMPVPAYAAIGTLLSSLALAAGDQINFYNSNNPAVNAFAVGDARLQMPTRVPAGAEVFSITNGNGAANAFYNVVWQLRL